MRIIAGKFRGLALSLVGKGDLAAHLRPTTDRVRESIFNLLAGGRFGDPIKDARVLDLFAGTGALGLEALSRGAAHVTFVDDGAKSNALIRKNMSCAKRVGKRVFYAGMPLGLVPIRMRRLIWCLLIRRMDRRWVSWLSKRP